MSSTLDKLIRMANQIALNVEARGKVVAIDETAEHIGNFWDPDMRNNILDYANSGGEGLSPIAKAAIEKIASNSA